MAQYLFKPYYSIKYNRRISNLHHTIRHISCLFRVRSLCLTPNLATIEFFLFVWLCSVHARSVTSRIRTYLWGEEYGSSGHTVESKTVPNDLISVQISSEFDILSQSTNSVVCMNVHVYAEYWNQIDPYVYIFRYLMETIRFRLVFQLWWIVGSLPDRNTNAAVHFIVLHFCYLCWTFFLVRISVYLETKLKKMEEKTKSN